MDFASTEKCDLNNSEVCAFQVINFLGRHTDLSHNLIADFLKMQFLPKFQHI